MKNKFVDFVRSAIAYLMYVCIGLIEKLQRNRWVSTPTTETTETTDAYSPAATATATHCDAQDENASAADVREFVDLDDVVVDQIWYKYLNLYTGHIEFGPSGQFRDTHHVKLPSRLHGMAHHGDYVNPKDHRTLLGKWYGQQRKKRGIVIS